MTKTLLFLALLTASTSALAIEVCDRDPDGAACLYLRSEAKRLSLTEVTENAVFERTLVGLADDKFGPGQYKLEGIYVVGPHEICQAVAFDIRPTLRCEIRADH